MGVVNRFVLGVVWVGMTVAIAGVAFAGDLKSPDSIRAAWRKLVAEYADMGRKVVAERYDRLPHDDQEFQEESAALRVAIANEPADFRTSVESGIARALTASTHLAEVSATHDQKQVQSALDDLANSLQSLNALFPPSVRLESIGPN